MSSNNYLQDLAGQYNLKYEPRIRNLIWLFFTKIPDSSITDWDLMADHLPQKINDNINRINSKNQKFCHILLRNLHSALDEIVDHSEFEWIEQNNRRQFEFIKKHIIENSIHGKHGRCHNFNVSTLKGKDLLIANFDIAIVGKSRRATLMSIVKIQWNKTIESDRLFSWYKRDLDRKLDVTWGWLCKYEKEAIKGILPPSSEEDVKIIFDRICQDRAGKELRLLKIKRRLSQVKYHQSRKITKDPLFLEIDKDVKKTLIEASEISGKSMTEIVELLIKNMLPHHIETNYEVPKKFGSL